MKSLIIAIVSALVLGISLSHSSGQTSLQGKVTDARTNEPILFGTVALMKDGVIIKGVETDLDGNYYFSDINPGTYDVEASFVGYTPVRQTGVIIKADKANRLNIQIGEGVLADEICITEYRAPLVEFDNTTTGGIVTSEAIKNLPTKSVNAIAATTAGIAAQNGSNDISIRGGRANGTVYYMDGIRVTNAGLVTTKDQEAAPTATTHKSKSILNYHEKEEMNYNPNESYSSIVENKFVNPTDEALSTFSIDVDRAGYSNVRRYLDNGQMPPQDAIRIEEMINYFDYDYEGPKTDVPFAIHSSLVDCPWNNKHQIMHVALQGKDIEKDKLPLSNFVFLIDVSGSMSSANKLPLVKTSMKMLLQEMRPKDKVSIVVYAGAAGLVLEPTSASEPQKILDAIDHLKSGGSTAGGAGIKLAYKTAKSNFIKGGNNRVILATDGDFNVGTSSDMGLEDLIEKERKSGVFLSVLGYGMGNYKDSKMQILADKGNGNHAYIDNIQEARKIFVSEFAGTLFTIAKDVKIQVEFNPAYVQSYRLIGYENRMLQKEDFNNDKIDAGELGAGHTVTALYEIIPVGVESSFAGAVDDLKYQGNDKKVYNNSKELATIKLRYKEPDGNKSKKLVQEIGPEAMNVKEAPEHVRFAMSIAQFGLSIRKSDYINTFDMNDLIQLAESSKSHDPEGYKAECVRLMKSAQLMDNELMAGKE